ncbi:MULTISPECIES: DUF58 domain-containing protein [unclassified Haladaptatus]|uniref:DUF58 domain-containing protein n=1 Tax=unclassified Haladaptatus TaxID=2622732 RepID=UPI00209C4076|nr:MULTISPECIES: DUF58 domain-containing protein [unclassified Haladaptatus]MCO8247040.1 DUF58 domain-containing protein [Haladaptatus sp. AB643]MCO8254576.1 DUF58 domain-containing protein [Haladaptatus sp. AB618]
MNVIRETNRWHGVSAMVLLAAGVGIFTESPVTLLIGVVGVAFAAYARTATPPSTAFELTRVVRDPTPAPGDETEVEVTVENVGDRTAPDLRVIDGVPDGLRVTGGSPRIGTALRPGKRAVFTYTVEAVRGDHEFDPAQALARDFSGALEREFELEDETKISCTSQLESTAEDVPLREQTIRHVGQVTTREGGTGIEFFATREYRPGDPLSRIDWKRKARTGELTTVEFREERTATVVLLVDVRKQAYLTSDHEDPGAVEHSIRAAGDAFSALLDNGDRVGIAALGPEDAWLAPATGETHRVEARELLSHASAFARTPSDETFYSTMSLRWLQRRLPSDAQVVFFSPLCDDFAPKIARRLDAIGHAVTVVSPDPTTDVSVGERLAQVERRQRLQSIRASGIRAVDWDTDELLGVTLAKMNRRWAR